MKSDKKQLANLSVRHEQAYQGPIPDPDSLARYEQIQPGFAERIMRMAEEEAIHRRSNENKIIKGNVRMAMLGIVFAFLSVIVFAGIVIFAIREGSSVAALGAVITSICSLAGVFIFFRNQTKQR
ncbi:MAG: DUF2335 domain-containing protein [Prevotellaceae bacterium]|jgi:uncharacterized membrane protein|nr:DUF2335 domain-containing protein [Prevotellaceae bacterium]